MEKTMMETHIRAMVARLHERVEKEIPEWDDFEAIEEGFENPDPRLVVQRFWLEAMQPPKGVKDRAWLRGLKWKASRRGSGGEIEILVKAGKKAELLQTLQEESFVQRLVQETHSLSYNLEDLAD